MIALLGPVVELLLDYLRGSESLIEQTHAAEALARFSSAGSDVTEMIKRRFDSALFGWLFLDIMIHQYWICKKWTLFRFVLAHLVNLFSAGNFEKSVSDHRSDPVPRYARILLSYALRGWFKLMIATSASKIYFHCFCRT